MLILDAYIKYMKSSASIQVVELRFLSVFFAIPLRPQNKSAYLTFIWSAVVSKGCRLHVVTADEGGCGLDEAAYQFDMAKYKARQTGFSVYHPASEYSVRAVIHFLLFIIAQNLKQVHIPLRTLVCDAVTARLQNDVSKSLFGNKSIEMGWFAVRNNA